MTAIGDLGVRLSLADVTQGVMLHGTVMEPASDPAPARNTEIGVALALPLMATTAIVPSLGFRYALTASRQRLAYRRSHPRHRKPLR